MNVALCAPARPPLSAHAIRQEAKAFCIWRAGMRHEWKVTAADLEKEVNINAKTIRTIARARGWPLRDGIVGVPLGYSPSDQIAGVDTVMRDPSRGWAAFHDRDDA